MPKLNQAMRKAAGGTKMGGSGATKAADLHHEPVLYPRVNADDLCILAVDPGETHVGLAVGCRYFVEGPGTDPQGMDEWTLQAPGWRVYDVAELTPPEFVRWFKNSIQHFDIVSCEKFTLYPHLAKEQVGSEMPTSKLIGWIENTIMLWNEDMTKDPAGRAYRYPEIQYESYPANIHAGTSSVMKKRDIPFVSPLSPDHARSAELHLWHTLIRAGLVEGVVLA
ncbi:hypothetical protein SEA_MARKY_46 [Streptomyces phage Marky]|nr:hypothetical protein SEA_MARKY_46 [Streptomyces phage Marky]